MFILMLATSPETNVLGTMPSSLDLDNGGDQMKCSCNCIEMGLSESVQ